MFGEFHADHVVEAYGQAAANTSFLLENLKIRLFECPDCAQLALQRENDILLAAANAEKARVWAEEAMLFVMAEEQEAAELLRLQIEAANEENRKSRILKEENRKKLVLAEDNRRKLVLAEENRKKLVLAEENRKKLVLAEENRKELVLAEENRKKLVLAEENRKQLVLADENRKKLVLAQEHRRKVKAVRDQLSTRKRRYPSSHSRTCRRNEQRELHRYKFAKYDEHAQHVLLRDQMLHMAYYENWHERLAYASVFLIEIYSIAKQESYIAHLYEKAWAEYPSRMFKGVPISWQHWPEATVTIEYNKPDEIFWLRNDGDLVKDDPEWYNI